MGLLSRTLELRWRGDPAPLRSLASKIHENIRTKVLAQIERNEPVHFVCGGLARPPGPVRLVFEDRRRGLPGRRFSGKLEGEAPSYRMSLESSRFRPVPAEFLAAIRDAVVALPDARECSEWSEAASR